MEWWENSNYETNTKYDEMEAYMFICFEQSKLQSFKNSITRSGAVLRNYQGRVLGFGEEMQIVEGDWPCNRLIAVLHFHTMALAKRWIQSDDNAKQPDWLTWVDIVLAPIEGAPPDDKTVFQITDVNVFNKNYYRDYLPKEMKCVKEYGGHPGIVVSKTEPETVRGLWCPQCLVVNQWNSVTDFDKHMKSDTFQALREKRQKLASVSTVVFRRVQLCHQDCQMSKNKKC